MHAYAPAKINLSLAMTGRRPDGYHLLDSLMCPIALYDELTLARNDSGVFTFSCSDPSLTGADNLVCRAVEKFCALSDIAPSFHLHLKKNIPSQAGLGGGSSDAACALRLLRDCYADAAVGEQALFALALSLGADVPFFLQSNGLMRARGIGEVLSPVPNVSPFALLLLKPALGLSTQQVFHAYDQAPSPLAQNVAASLEALRAGDWSAFARQAGNDLQATAQALCPDIAPLLDALRGCGARYTCMSGTGTTVFGVFSTLSEAQAAAQQLAGRAALCLPVQALPTPTASARLHP